MIVKAVKYNNEKYVVLLQMTKSSLKSVGKKWTKETRLNTYIGRQQSEVKSALSNLHKL